MVIYFISHVCILFYRRMKGMKSLVVYYSYTGHTKAIAQKTAESESAEIAEISGVTRPGIVKALFFGCPAAIYGKSWPIKPLSADLKAFDRIILLSPVWAGNAPPTVNELIKNLPENKTVTVKMISSTGRSSWKKHLEPVLSAKKCVLESYEDIIA